MSRFARYHRSLADSSSQNLSPVSTRSSQVATHDPKRPYTSSLPLPKVAQGLSREPSVVSDAGAEEQIRKQIRASGVVKPQISSGSQEFLESLSLADSPYELQDQILDSLKRTKKYQNQEREFLPARKLRRLVDPGTVSTELNKTFGKSHTEDEIRSYTSDICSEIIVERERGFKTQSFRKIFALLVILEATASIRLFLQDNVSDLDLPLVWPSNGGMKGLCRKDADGHSLGEPLKCFSKWSRVKLRNFYEYQWKLLAPFFSKTGKGEVKHYPLREDHILPFVECNGVSEEDSEKSGGYGKVSMVQIHPDHHDFEDPKLSSKGFAVKQQLYEGDTAVFQTEIDVLKKFSGGRGHAHIVSLLATFEQFRRLNLIFYRAQGDLFAYWSDSVDAPARNHSNIKWLSKQCAGLADGLLRLHRHLTFTKHRTDPHDAAPPFPHGM